MICIQFKRSQILIGFQFASLGNKGLHTLQIGDINTKSDSSVTLLGITNESKFNLSIIL